MADEKELMKKDLSLIIQIDSKMHYNDIQNVQKIYEAITQKNMFQTSLGKRYVNKLKQIIQGENTGNCIFCGKSVTNPNNTVMCEECSSKFIKKPTDTTQATSQNASTLADNTKNKIQSGDIKSQAQSIGRNISENENLQRSKECAKEMTRDIKKSMSKNNNSTADNASTSQQSAKRKSIVIIGIIALLIIIAIISVIGIETIFSIATIVSLGYLIYTCVKKKPKKKAIIVFVVCILLTGIANGFSTGIKSDNVLAYLGTSQEQAYKDYDSSQFREEICYLTNENEKTNGKPWIEIWDGKVSTVILDSGMNSSLNVSGVHIGDSIDDITIAMEKQGAAYDTNGSMSGIMETYNYKYDGTKVQVIFIIKNGIVTRIVCGLED